MPELKMMMFDNGTDLGIRCRFVSEWYKINTYVPDKEGLLSEIKKNKHAYNLCCSQNLELNNNIMIFLLKAVL